MLLKATEAYLLKLCSLIFLQSQEGICSIAKVPFRGAPCSDAAGKQKTYKWIMQQVNSSLSGRLWDSKQQAPYFNYKVHHLLHIFKYYILLFIQQIPTFKPNFDFFVCLF